MGIEREMSEFADELEAQNTRPAPPVEGLETYMRADFGTVDLVTRLQSEAIIAARDRLLAASDTVAQQLQKQIVTLTLKKEDLEADNAALTARVKELEEQLHYSNGVSDLAIKHRDEAENQLAVARKALGEISSQKLIKEIPLDEYENASFEDAYDTMIELSRATLEDKP